MVQRKKPTLADRELALEAREKEVIEAEKFLKEKVAAHQADSDALADVEASLKKADAELNKFAAELEQREIRLAERENLLAEKSDDPLAKVKAISVTSRTGKAFCRGGRRFGSVAEIVACSELSISELDAIRKEPNLKVKEVLA